MKKLKRHVPELAIEIIEKQYIEDPPLFKNEKWTFFFIIDLFYRLRIFNKNAKFTKDDYLRISSKYFRSYISKNYSSYIAWLIKHDIILCDKIKKEGKSYAYAVHPNVQSKIKEVEIPKDSIIGKKIIQNYNEQRKYHKNPGKHILSMRKSFEQNLKINLEEALEWLEEQFKNKKINFSQLYAHTISIEMINNEEFYFKINKTNGRLDTNLTNLKSELRQFVKGNLYSIDCKNSQPLILNFILEYIIQNNNKYKLISSSKNPLPPPFPLCYPSLGTEGNKMLSKYLNIKDLEVLRKFPLSEDGVNEFRRYKLSTFKSDFYEDMAKEYAKLHKKPLLRKQMKELMYKVFFSSNFSFKEEKKIFKKNYPVVYEVIFRLKNSKSYNKLAICLQGIESEIFIQNISKKLVENNIIPLTIHDSLVVFEKDINLALKIIENVYLEIFQEIPQFQCSKL